MTRIRIIGLTVVGLLLASLLSVSAVFAFRHGREWYELNEHFRYCQALHLATTKFYADHHAETPSPVASFTTLKDGGYITEKMIGRLNQDAGVYSFFIPPFADSAAPLIGYFSAAHTIIITVAGDASISRGPDAPAISRTEP